MYIGFGAARALLPLQDSLLRRLTKRQGFIGKPVILKAPRARVTMPRPSRLLPVLKQPRALAASLSC
jgi:hypothetical protein